MRVYVMYELEGVLRIEVPRYFIWFLILLISDEWTVGVVVNAHDCKAEGLGFDSNSRQNISTMSKSTSFYVWVLNIYISMHFTYFMFIRCLVITVQVMFSLRLDGHMWDVPCYSFIYHLSSFIRKDTLLCRCHRFSEGLMNISKDRLK